MKKIDKRDIMIAVIALVMACLSMFVISKYASSPEVHAKTIESLDEKKTTVMELTAASAAASAAITLLPGDTATPIADKLADLGSYFLVVLCAIYLEKYLVTITGYAAFQLLIPAACLLWAVSMFWKKQILKRLAVKLAVFGCAIALVIPAGVKVSDMIETTYQASIEETLEAAKQTTQEIEEGAKTAEENNGSLSGIFSKVKDEITEATTGMMKKMEQMLSNFLEALAVMLVTSCVIPMIVLLFFWWLTKLILGMNINLPEKELE